MFTYTYLRNAHTRGASLGAWRNTSVYACTKETIPNIKSSDVYYVIYDDGNLIYKDGRVYGKVSENGAVEEFDVSKVYPRRSKKEETPKEEKIPARRVEDSVVGDVELGIEVDKMLNSAETMTIDDLLKGFNYGLD